MQRILLFILMLIIVSCKKELTPASGTIDESSNYIPTPSVESIQTPPGLPKRIGFGTDGAISDMDQFIKESDYQYQYLAGDIFSKGWTTWNSPSGEFARIFLNKTSQMGKVPVFTYYNIVPAKNRFEDPGFTNLNDAEVMNKYFEDWKFLLQICKNYGKTVIIHYEPDLFGYMQMFKNDASKRSVKVSQSGFVDVKNFSNDAKGLAQAIVSMRNKYASNVLLAWHASQWATGYGVISGKHNPEQAAAETVAYYKDLDAPFDLIFSEFADRDAAYDQLVNGKSNVEWSTQPSAANGNLSDYDRFQRFLKKLSYETGQKIILWQIPIGNKLTATCNNTSGHYKDNKAEYFFQPVLENSSTAKISEYGQAGVIAFLFGSGNSDCTNYWDAKDDGVTGANETADDDGGYLRKAVKAYYEKGAVLVP